jgi:flagellin-like hook-associated protein FlgL
MPQPPCQTGEKLFKEETDYGLIINHNMMAMNAARNLSTIYSKLATSTQRLSSGLRINSAADDAAVWPFAS